MNHPEFTQQQKDFICYQIGEWYVRFKDRLVDYNDRTHRLGFAKEVLKTMICDTPEEQMRMVADIAAGLMGLPDDE